MKKTKTIKDLRVYTNAFLDKHWNDKSFGARPIWSEKWEFKGTIPNHKSRGCYAFFAENGEMLYIGIGIGKNGVGKYTGHGLGNRLYRIWKSIPGQPGEYRKSKDYDYIDHVRTISFGGEENPFWLAAALEIFLIHNLKPEKNVTYKTD